MLHIPICGQSILEDNQATTSAEYGTSVAAGGSAHTKNTTFTTLIAATAFDAWGITICVGNTAVASTRTGVLVDIAIGAASSEVVIIPNLIAGNQAASATTSLGGSLYHFPIFIPRGVRVSATAQAFTGGDTVNVAVWLNQHRNPGKWYGCRVTAYGPDTATSSGVSMSPGNNTYATDVDLAASTARPIKYLQIGTDLLTNSTGSTLRGLIRLTVGASVIAGDLPYFESTTLESVDFTPANLILSHMNFNIPAGSDLEISAMRNAAAATRGWAAYGVE